MNHSRLQSIIIFSVLSTVASAQSVIASASYGGHTYHLLSNSNWTSAQSAAVGLGGHLVTINDAAENAFVYDTFSAFGGQGRNLWIGLNDVASEGVHVWASGEVSSFLSWYPGEPNNFGDEDYVHLLRPGFNPAYGWNDAPDVANYGAASIGALYGVVEVVPEPSSLLVLGVATVALAARRRQN